MSERRRMAAKTVRITFSASARETLEALKEEAADNNEQATLVRSIEQKLECIRQNSHFGNPIAKRLLPKKYKSGTVTNIFRVELPLYWRMLYTLRNEDTVEIIAFVLDIVDHEGYDGLFGYKKR